MPPSPAMPPRAPPALLLLLLLAAAAASAEPRTRSCSEVKRLYVAKGFSQTEAPNHEINGEGRLEGQLAGRAAKERGGGLGGGGQLSLPFFRLSSWGRAGGREAVAATGVSGTLEPSSAAGRAPGAGLFSRVGKNETDWGCSRFAGDRKWTAASLVPVYAAFFLGYILQRRAVEKVFFRSS